jgi:hypothetical protein
LLGSSDLSSLSQCFCISAAWKNQKRRKKKTARQLVRGGWLGVLRQVSGGPLG